jgi:LPXTG-motif cell wall-anchored protein
MQGSSADDKTVTSANDSKYPKTSDASSKNGAFAGSMIILALASLLGLGKLRKKQF